MIKSQRPQFLDDYGLWLFSCFAEKTTVFQLCKLQIWTEIIKIRKGEKPYADPFAALDPHGFSGNRKRSAAQNCFGVIAAREKKGRDKQ